MEINQNRPANAHTALNPDDFSHRPTDLVRISHDKPTSDGLLLAPEASGRKMMSAWAVRELQNVLPQMDQRSGDFS